nr:uncharacterized protein LOC125181858 [Anser cygnoides]
MAQYRPVQPIPAQLNPAQPRSDQYGPVSPSTAQYSPPPLPTHTLGRKNSLFGQGNFLRSATWRAAANQRPPPPAPRGLGGLPLAGSRRGRGRAGGARDPPPTPGGGRRGRSEDAAGGVAVAGGAVAGGGLPPPERGPPRVPHDDSHGFAYDHEAFLGPEQARAFDQLTPEESRHRLGLLVGLIDGDGDGAVTAAELRDWMERTRRRARAESVQQGRQRYDRDGDGAVRWDEYRREAYGTPGEGVRGGTPWRGHPIKAISHKGGSP